MTKGRRSSPTAASFSRFEILGGGDTKMEVLCDRPVTLDMLRSVLAQGDIHPATFSLFYYMGDDLVASEEASLLPSIGDETPHGKVMGVIDASCKPCDRMFVVDLEPVLSTPKKMKKRAIKEKA